MTTGELAALADAVDAARERWLAIDPSEDLAGAVRLHAEYKAAKKRFREALAANWAQIEASEWAPDYGNTIRRSLDGTEH